MIPEQAECFLSGDNRIDAEFSVMLKNQFGEFEQGRFVVDVENVNHGKYTLDTIGLSRALLNSFLSGESPCIPSETG